MTYKEAVKFGRECGLQKPFEFVNNILIHAEQIFAYSQLQTEIEELFKEAKEIGINFAECGHADELAGKGKCYMCEKLEKAMAENVKEEIEP